MLDAYLNQFNKHPLRVILAGLDVVHADHPKAQQVRALVTELGESWPC
jgi:hypothetical protein